jgi:hypothetical protein
VLEKRIPGVFGRTSRISGHGRSIN